MEDKNNLKMGVEWGYLKALLNNYTQLQEAYITYQGSINGLSNYNQSKKFLIINLKGFYSSVMANFDKYLKVSSDIIPSDYRNLSIDVTHSTLEDLYFIIVNWSQISGPFATMTERNDPYGAFSNG